MRNASSYGHDMASRVEICFKTVMICVKQGEIGDQYIASQRKNIYDECHLTSFGDGAATRIPKHRLLTGSITLL